MKHSRKVRKTEKAFLRNAFIIIFAKMYEM